MDHATLARLVPLLALGVDLASQPTRTGCARLAVHPRHAVLDALEVGCDDDRILALAEHVDVVGIDSPFGWPQPFVARVAGHTEPEPWTNEVRDRLAYRRTDAHVRARFGRWPLSVSTDRIGLPALRCAGLLHRLGVTDRSGGGRVVETYPAFGLHRWGLRASGYKTKADREERAEVWRGLRLRAPWLRATADQDAACLASSDALDAVVAAILALCAHRGLVDPVPESERLAARTEGWIAVVAEDALERLFPSA
ncbi:MAG: DUF429 domain-containing protein [Sandaracinaceae bacterium]